SRGGGPLLDLARAEMGEEIRGTRFLAADSRELQRADGGGQGRRAGAVGLGAAGGLQERSARRVPHRPSASPRIPLGRSSSRSGARPLNRIYSLSKPFDRSSKRPTDWFSYPSPITLRYLAQTAS